MKKVFVVSDSTGNTADSVVRAALIQFGYPAVELRMWPQVRTIEQAQAVLARASESGALIVHTLVNAELRMYVTDNALAAQVQTVDLIGALLDTLSNFLGDQPQQVPGVRHRMDELYFRRIAAMEFTVKADDGQDAHSLAKADIILVGVSRTSKTPVSTYLAGQGYKVANIPLVMGIEPIESLFAQPSGKVFALTIDPEKLMDIRQNRLAHLGITAGGQYTNRDHVFQEVRWALQLYRRRTNWPVIDVSNLAVEETASEILRLRRDIVAESRVDEG